MRLRRRNGQRQSLFASLFLLQSVVAEAPYPLEQRQATITAHRAAVTTQATLPFYFGPPALYDPYIDLGTLFVASVVEANETYTAIQLACQPANGIASGYKCDLDGIIYMATQISSSTHIHYWASAGAPMAGSGALSSAAAVNEICEFLDDTFDEVTCTAYKTATEVMGVNSKLVYPLESQVYGLSGSLTMDHIPITAGGEKLPFMPTQTTSPTAGSNGGSGGSSAASSTSTSKPKTNAAAVGKPDSVLEGGSTFGLVIGILAWALI